MATERQRKTAERRRRNTGASPGGSTLIAVDEVASPAAEPLGRVTLEKSVDGSSAQDVYAGEDAWSPIYELGNAIAPVLPLSQLLLLSEQNPIHSACCEAVAADSVGKGWKLSIRRGVAATDVNEETEREQTEMTFDWLESITPAETFQEILDHVAWEYRTTGWSLIEVAREGGNPAGNIASIFPMASHTMRATKNKDVFVQQRGLHSVFYARFGCGYQVNAKTGKKDGVDGTNVANEVIVLKRFTPRSPSYGLPRWVSAIPTIAELTAIREYNVSWFASGGQMDRHFHVTAEDAEAAKTVSEALKKQAEEARGRGHTTLNTYGTSDVEVAVEMLTAKEGARDGQFGNRRDDLAKEVLMAHSVPPYRIGWAEIGALGGSAAKEMLRAYRSGAIDPTQELIEARLKRSLFNSKLGGLELGLFVFTLVDIDWEQLEQDIKLVAMAVDKGVITPNEGRAHLGWEQSDDDAADKLYYMGVPLDTLPAAGTQGTGVDGTDDRQMQQATDELRKAFVEVVRVRKQRVDAEALSEAEDERERQLREVA